MLPVASGDIWCRRLQTGGTAKSDRDGLCRLSAVQESGLQDSRDFGAHSKLSISIFQSTTVNFIVTAVGNKFKFKLLFIGGDDGVS
jgi:hypothetical protein